MFSVGMLPFLDAELKSELDALNDSAYSKKRGLKSELNRPKLCSCLNMTTMTCIFQKVKLPNIWEFPNMVWETIFRFSRTRHPTLEKTINIIHIWPKHAKSYRYFFLHSFVSFCLIKYLHILNIHSRINYYKAVIFLLQTLNILNSSLMYCSLYKKWQGLMKVNLKFWDEAERAPF